MEKTVYHFGEKYYDKSGTMMGVMYTESGQRYDYGFMKGDLGRGITVIVKPATSEMIAWAEKVLAEKYGVAV